jgi:hypothetical protein
MTATKPEASGPAPDSSLTRLLETEQRLSVEAALSRRQAVDLVARARAAASQAESGHRIEMQRALEALAARVDGEVLDALAGLESERERRLALYDAAHSRVAELADAAVATLLRLIGPPAAGGAP